MKLKAVFFDLDDTLYSTTEFAKTARSNAIKAMQNAGLDLPFDMLLRELNETISEFATNYEHHFDKLLLRLPKNSFKKINPAIIVAAGMIGYHDTKFTQLAPYKDVVPLLKVLQKSKIISGVISAGLEVKQSEKLIRLKIHQYFNPDAIFISEQIGISKPNPKLFVKACSDVGVNPSESMYVGNDLAHDIEPANKVGMVSVLAKRNVKVSEKAKIVPKFEVNDFEELYKILRWDFGLDLDELN